MEAISMQERASKRLLCIGNYRYQFNLREVTDMKKQFQQSNYVRIKMIHSLEKIVAKSIID